MEKFSVRLQKALDVRGMKPVDLHVRTKLSESLISKYLADKAFPRQDKSFLMAQALNVSEAWLLGYDVPMERANASITNVIPLPDKPMPLPVLGKISAGLPLLASQDIIGYDYAPSSNLKTGHEYFYLIVNGDSMNLKFKDGDRLLVQKQECLENGEIGVIMVNGDDATVKRFRTENDMVILEPMSSNPEHHVQMYNLKSTPIKIIGKVILSISNVN